MGIEKEKLNLQGLIDSVMLIIENKIWLKKKNKKKNKKKL